MRARLLLPLLLAFAACGSDPLAGAARGVEVSASLGAAETRTIDFEVRNRGWRTVYVAACDGHVVGALQPRDQWDDESAGEVSVFCLAIYSAIPVAVEPGGSVRGQARAFAAGEHRVGVVVSHERRAERQRPVFSGGVIVPQ